MQKIIVNGGRALDGEIRVSGSKNAALPLIFATLLINGETTLFNVPDIGDVRVALELLSDFGAEISFFGSTLRINAKKVKYKPENPELSGKIRASTYLLGATLGRFGRAEIPASGGCNFSNRPIDFHINAAKSFGATLSGGSLIADKLHGAKISLPKPSVGATINALLMAVSALGDSEISGYAKEPHVLAVVDFLHAAGAKIQLENDKILVHPAPLHPTEFTVIGDMIEAGTYLTAAMITGGNITVSGIDFRELSSFLNIAEELGFTPEILPLISFENEEKSAVFTSKKLFSSIRIDSKKLLSSIRIDSKKRKFSGNKISVSAAPYPAFPTDLQPIIAPILAKESGGQIRDFVFPERFGYLENLATFGIKSRVVDKCAKIEKSRLKSGSAIAPDLRGGMACLLAALGANGCSEIHSPEIILRGYDRLAEKLTSLGADVKTIKM